MKEEELKKYIKKLIETTDKNGSETFGYDIEISTVMAQDLLNLLEKKDKIIEKLEDIFYNYQLCEYEITDCTYRKCEYISDDEKRPCRACIKEYFKKKVEEK